MSIKDKAPAFLGFSRRFLPRSSSRPVSQAPKLPGRLAARPAGRVAVTPRLRARRAVGGAASRSARCLPWGAARARPAARRRNLPPLPPAPPGPAFLRLEQQLSLRRRLGRGQAGRSRGASRGARPGRQQGPPKGVRPGARVRPAGRGRSAARGWSRRPPARGGRMASGAGGRVGLTLALAAQPGALHPGSTQFSSIFHSSSEDFLTSERGGRVVTTEERS